MVNIHPNHWKSGGYMSKLNEQGWEVPDQTPVAVPAYIKKWDQRDSIREMIREQLSREMQDAGFESWEDADDFDVGDDYDPNSPYEEQFDPETGESLWYAMPGPSGQDQPGDGDAQFDASEPAGNGAGTSGYGSENSPLGDAA